MISLDKALKVQDNDQTNEALAKCYHFRVSSKNIGIG